MKYTIDTTQDFAKVFHSGKTRKIRIEPGTIGYLHEDGAYVDTIKNQETFRLSSGIFHKRSLTLINTNEIMIPFEFTLIAKDNMPVKFSCEIAVRISEPLQFLVEVLNERNSVSKSDISGRIAPEILTTVTKYIKETKSNELNKDLISEILEKEITTALLNSGMEAEMRDLNLSVSETSFIIVDGIRCSDEPHHSERFTWDPRTETLTLNSAHIGQIRRIGGSLNLVLTETNVIHSNGTGIGVRGGKLTISGKGSLMVTAFSENWEERVRGICADSIIIEDNVTIKSVSENGHGISAIGDITIRNHSFVTAVGTGSNGCGVYSGLGDIVITKNSTLKAESKSDGIGVFSGGNLKVDTGSSVSSTGKGGVSVRGTCTLDSGTLTSHSRTNYPGTNVEKLEIKGSRFLSSGKGNAVSSRFEKIDGRIMAGPNLQTMTLHNRIPNEPCIFVE